MRTTVAAVAGHLEVSPHGARILIDEAHYDVISARMAACGRDFA